MIHNAPHPYAGQTVNLRAGESFGGVEFRLEDWWDRVSGASWMEDVFSNPACLNYATRVAFRVPPDDEVVYGKVDGLGYLVHVSELDLAS